MSIIAWLVVGAIAGWLASMIVPGNERYGWIGGLVVGIVGGVVGGWLFGQFTGQDWTTGINIPTLIAATVGAIVVVLLWNTITRRGTPAP